jgi:hypothetical protein
MNTLKLNLSENQKIDLSSIKEDYIKLKSIESNTFENIELQKFLIKTVFPDGRIKTQEINLGSHITPFDRENKISVNIPIEDCNFSTIEALISLNANYTIQYETFLDILKKTGVEEIDKKNKIKKDVQEWTNSVDQIFSQTEKWLLPYKENLKIVLEEITSKEENTDDYTISTLTIIRENENLLKFAPIGTYILGAKGRIDITSDLTSLDSYMLILQNYNNTEKWYIVKNKDYNSKKEYTQSQLLILIENVIEAKSKTIQGRVG